MLAIYLEAPFAVSRTFTAGWYRPTATFLSPSLVYGLLLNFAGIESRLCEENVSHSGSTPATLTRLGLPPLKVALGAAAARPERGKLTEIPQSDRFPRVQSIYQQLHNYPVGSSGSDRAALTFGSKYNITPVRREILSDIRAVIAVRAQVELEDSIRHAITSGATAPRYGLPFLGDNSFLLDRICLLKSFPPTHWYERASDTEQSIKPRTTRLTIFIDREDSSQTKSQLYTPSLGSSDEGVPPLAWTDISPPAANRE